MDMLPASGDGNGNRNGNGNGHRHTIDDLLGEIDVAFRAYSDASTAATQALGVWAKNPTAQNHTVVVQTRAKLDLAARTFLESHAALRAEQGRLYFSYHG